jgi:hypothetical protein
VTGEPTEMGLDLIVTTYNGPKSGQVSNYALHVTLHVKATEGGKTGIGRALPSVALIMSLAPTPSHTLLIINYLTKLIIFEILCEK